MEALDLLHKSTLVDPDSIRVDERGGLVPRSEATIYWQNKDVAPLDDTWPAMMGGNLAIVRDDIVDSIQLLVYTSTCSLSVRQVVERYGTPEKILFAPRGASPHFIWHTLDLYYFTQGLAFVAHADNPPHGEQQVGIVYGFAPTTWNDLLASPRRYTFQSSIYVEDGSHVVGWREALESWQGFADGP